ADDRGGKYPAITPSERPEAENAVGRVEPSQDAFAEKLAQRLRCAAAKRAVAGAAIEARHRGFVGEAIAAMHLDPFPGAAQRHLVAEELGDRREIWIREWVCGCAGAIENAAAGLDLLVHLGELPAHALEFADRPPEGRALARVTNSFLEGALGEAERDA